MAAMSREAASEPDRVRVVVVDDDDAMRLLLRLQFELDGRFDVVGEAADGQAAIDLAEALQPDLVVLALHMPGLSVVDAIPEIRRRATESAVMLYTLKTGDGTYQAALAAGALDRKSVV